MDLNVSRIKNEFKNRKINYKLSLNFIYKSDKIDVEIGSGYPFTPPKKIFINKKLLDFQYNLDKKQRSFIKKYYNIDCFCCSSLLCYNNWKPAHTIFNILDQHYNALKRISVVKNFVIILNKIELPEDIIRYILLF